VSKPEKVGDGMNAYVIYSVSTKNLDGSVATISRRYNDFSWLHDVLRSEFLHILIPPLPEKVIFDRFSPEIVEYRRKELERFLKRVLSHAYLGKSQHVKTFLTANEITMEIERNKQKTGTTASPLPEKKKIKAFLHLSPRV